MPSSHEVGELAFDERSGRPVVGPPGRIPGGGATGREERLLRVDVDPTAIGRARAAGDQWAGKAGPAELGVGADDTAERGDPAGRAGDRAGREVDREVVFGEVAGDTDRRLDLDATDRAGGIERGEDLAGTVGRVARSVTTDPAPALPGVTAVAVTSSASGSSATWPL